MLMRGYVAGGSALVSAAKASEGSKRSARRQVESFMSGEESGARCMTASRARGGLGEADRKQIRVLHDKAQPPRPPGDGAHVFAGFPVGGALGLVADGLHAVGTREAGKGLA